MSKPNILLVEDDPSMRRLVAFILQNEGFEVQDHPDARGARAALEGDIPDLVILDLGLPDTDGIELAAELRQRADLEKVPVLALTARDQSVDKYEAYKAGFNGYFTKPFDPLELVLSIKAFLRLTEPEAEPGTPAELGPDEFRLYPSKFVLMVEGREVSLTRLETAVLAYLMRRPREVFSADELTEAVLESGNKKGRTTDAIHAHIRHLRAKVEADPSEPRWVMTLGRRGYYFAG